MIEQGVQAAVGGGWWVGQGDARGARGCGGTAQRVETKGEESERNAGGGWGLREARGGEEGGMVRAQHDAIRAGTQRSLRSERRDAFGDVSCETVDRRSPVTRGVSAIFLLASSPPLPPLPPSPPPPPRHERLCCVFCAGSSFFFFGSHPRHLERQVDSSRVGTRKHTASVCIGHRTATWKSRNDPEVERTTGNDDTTGLPLRAGAMFTQRPKRDRYVRVNFVIDKRERRDSAHSCRAGGKRGGGEREKLEIERELLTKAISD